MERLFEQTQQWIDEELSFWRSHLTKAAQDALAGSERLATDGRALFSKMVEEQTGLVTGFVTASLRHGIATAARQTDLLRAAFAAPAQNG